MRKQRQVLEHVSDIAFWHRQTHPPFGVEEYTRPDHDRSGIWGRESRNAIQQSGLTCSRGAKENGEARGQGEINVESEIVFPGEAFLQPNRNRRGHRRQVVCRR